MAQFTIDKIKELSESVDLEVKLAGGQNGKGSFSKSILETYSAMANTQGGEILLGIDEPFPGQFNIDSNKLGLSSGGLPPGSGGLDPSLQPLEQNEQLWDISKTIREKRKVSPEIMKQTILLVCKNQYLTLRDLAKLLGRQADFLRKNYLNHMMKEQKLTLRHPTLLNHPNQAYKTASSIKSDQ